jgi:hypothetical protein
VTAIAGATCAAWSLRRLPQALDRFGRVVRTASRPATAAAQAPHAFLLIASQPPVTGLPADVKIRAQLGQGKPARASQTDESVLLFHGGYFVPGHSLKV